MCHWGSGDGRENSEGWNGAAGSCGDRTGSADRRARSMIGLADVILRAHFVSCLVDPTSGRTCIPRIAAISHQGEILLWVGGLDLICKSPQLRTD